jgi:hypothetical protein
MKSRLLTLFGFFAVCSLAIYAQPPASDVAKDDIKKLQGDWQVIKFIDHSLDPAPPDELYLCVVGGMGGGKVAPRPTELNASKDPPYSLFVL